MSDDSYITISRSDLDALDNDMRKKLSLPQRPPDTNEGIIIGIVIFLLLSVFIVIILVYAFSGPTVQPPTTPTLSYFLDSCANITCATGLSCDGSTFTCRYTQGMTCNLYSDCSTGLICSGRCVPGDNIGGLDQYCPCNPPFICTTDPTTGYRICKGGASAPCTQNADCSSYTCVTSLGAPCTGSNCTCLGGLSNASPCSQNVECASNNCNQGFCQPKNVTTGTKGASCAGTCIPTAGAPCTAPLNCSCTNGQNAPGICVTAPSGLTDSCSSTSSCSSSLICYNTSGSACGTGTICSCEFPYTDPNVPPVNVPCISGMVGFTGCNNGPGLGCSSSSHCYATNKCSGPPTLTTYKFSATGLDFTSSYQTSLTGFTGSLSVVINPHKLFSISDGPTDSIYLVDYNNGFLSMQYDPVTHTVLQPWITLIPYSSSYGTLIDVTPNGYSFFFIVFYYNGYYVVYEWDIDNNNYTVFNSQTGMGPPGTQYDTHRNPISINYISSTFGSVALTSTSNIYVKPDGFDYYSGSAGISGLVGPAKYYQYTGSTGSYRDIAYIGYYSNIQPQILTFYGAASTYIVPIDPYNELYYSVLDYDLTGDFSDTGSNAIITLTAAYTIKSRSFVSNIVSLTYNGFSAFLPFRFDSTSKCACSGNAYYIISRSSCI